MVRNLAFYAVQRAHTQRSVVVILAIVILTYFTGTLAKNSNN